MVTIVSESPAAVLEKPAVLLDESLEESWDRKLRCQSSTHKSDPVSHEPEADATVRGYAPCGNVMNVCAKFAEAIRAVGWRSMPCQCGKRHFSSSFRFVSL